MRVKAVLFDMFDTLMLIEKNHAFYSPALRAAYEFLAKNGVSVGFQEFSRAYVEARDALYAEAEANLEEPHFNVRIAGALKRLGFDCGVSDGLVVGATDAFCEAFMKFVSIDKNAERMLRELHGKYKLGIVSNFAIPECVTKLLEKEGLDGFFDVVVVSGAVNKRKPSVEIFRKALETLGVKRGGSGFRRRHRGRGCSRRESRGNANHLHRKTTTKRRRNSVPRPNHKKPERAGSSD